MIIDWLVAPLDAARAHDVGAGIAWHGRLMVFAWGVLIPAGVFVARFFKVTPGQDWPREIDNRFWWRTHLGCQYAAGIAMLAGWMAILWSAASPGVFVLHRWLGLAALTAGALQFVAGWLRGSKGGPTEPEVRGDHYDMTARRILFERVHKSVGYGSLALAAAAILTGLHAANAPRWMWLGIVGWWAALLIATIVMERRGGRVTTYEAIWGPDPRHPGNRPAGG
jgi:hypothetical protein